MRPIPLSPGDIVTLIDKGINIVARFREKCADRLVGKSAEARALLSLYEFLREVYYDIPILTGPDGPFPVGLLPVSAAAASNADRLSVKLASEPPSPPVMHREIVEALRGRGELLETLCRSSAPLSVSDLPARERALGTFGSPRDCLTSGGGVDAVIGVSTLVVYARQSSYWMLCDVRSDRVAEYGALYHVVPSFIYQPVTATTAPNLSIEQGLVHNIYREYLEELFRIPEVEKVGKPVTPDFFYHHPNLALLRELEKGKAELSATAVVFNLLNHRPEVCTVLIIRDEAWFQRQKETTGKNQDQLRPLNWNDEFLANEAQTAETHLKFVTTLPLDSPQWCDVAKPGHMVPPGAPALVLGAKRAAEILGIGEPEWLRQYHIDEARDEPSGLS